MSESPTKSPAERPGEDETEPLGSLYKMSTTAGLGSSEYVAINAASVAALLLGLASGLAVFDNIFLVIPLAGIVCGIIAWRQVTNSNGTQTGKGLAGAGLVLSVVFGGFVIARQVTAAVVARGDKQEIADLIEHVGQTARAGDWDTAYALFSDRFQERVDRERFETQWSNFTNHGLYGTLESLRWNQSRLAFHVDADTGVRHARGMALASFDDAGAQFRYEMRFRRSDDRWLVENFPALFPVEDPDMQLMEEMLDLEELDLLR